MKNTLRPILTLLASLSLFCLIGCATSGIADKPNAFEEPEQEKLLNTSHLAPKKNNSAPDLGHQSTLVQSRFLEMAITRYEQMDHLVVPENSKSVRNENALDLSLDSVQKHNTESLETLGKQLAQRRKRFGDSDPYTIDAALQLLITMARNHQDYHALVLAVSKQWLACAKQLEHCYGAQGAAFKSNSSSKCFSDLVKQLGINRLCEWTHKSGEILAILCWDYNDNKQAKVLASEILKVDAIEAPTELSVHQLLTLSRLFSSQNEFAEARNAITMAKEACSHLVDLGVTSNKHQSMALCLLEESRLSSAESDFAASAELCQRAKEELDSSGDVQSGQSQAIMADILEQKAKAFSMTSSKIVEAIKMQQECLLIRQRRFGNLGIFSIATKLDLARLLRQQVSAERKSEFANLADPSVQRVNGMLLEILNECNKPQAVDTEILRSDRNFSLLLPRIYFELGTLNCICGSFVEGRKNISRAFEIDMSYREPKFMHYKVADLDAISAMDLREGKIGSARESTQKASKLLDAYVSEALPQLSLAEQIAFSKNIETHMNALLAVCRPDDSLEALYEDLLKWKGFLIELFRRRSMAVRTEDDHELKTLIKSHQVLTEQILDAYIRASLSGTELKVTERDLSASKEELERKINARTLPHEKAKSDLRVSLSGIKKTLAPEEAFIDLYEFQPHAWINKTNYLAIITSKKKCNLQELGPSTAIDETIDEWCSLASLKTPLPGSSSSIEKPGSASASQGDSPWLKLERLLALPLTRAIPANTLRLWISDQGQLSRLPWSVLMSGLGGAKEYELSQVDSPRELLGLRENSRRTGQSKQILLVGGVDFSNHVPPAPQLKNAMTELLEIKKQAEAKQLKSLILSDSLPKTASPNQSNIMKALGQGIYCHLITHGFFNNAEGMTDASEASRTLARNPLIESGILISRKSEKGNSGKGFITAEELLDADLYGCKLLTLSACDTGRGKAVNCQGIIGLRSALMGAGTKAVLLSLWPVPDKATSELMKSFYKKLLDGETPCRALKQAQVELRSIERWQAPRYWAAWVLVGDAWQQATRNQTP